VPIALARVNGDDPRSPAAILALRTERPAFIARTNGIALARDSASSMLALHRKLVRDLRLLRGQVITITLVVACGIASFVALRGNYASLVGARDRLYERQRFADVFSSLERAPQTLRDRIESIPGVRRVETRIVEQAMLPLEDVPEPLRARVASLPADGSDSLNWIRLESGRYPEVGHADEAVLLSGFAEAHGIVPGDRLPAVINGKRRDLRVVGTASSPEYVLAIGERAIAPDPARFAVLWMSIETLSAAFRMEGAFNDVALTLQPDGSEAAVKDELDRMLAPYGGLGAYSRARQASNFALEGELMQLQNMGSFLPAIFLAVAALLVNMVLSRLVLLQKPEIATLKALGYSNLRVGAHFLELVLVVAGFGAIGGVLLGEWIGSELVDVYSQYFKFPDLVFELDAVSVSQAVAASSIAAITGAFAAVYRVVRLPPAEAMRPPAPTRYRRSLIDRLGLARLVGPMGQMIVRELERRPLRSMLSAAAIAAATGLTVIGAWYYEGIDALLRTQFQEVMREDAAVTLLESRDERAVSELAHLPGVESAEGVRILPVRFRAEHRLRDGVVWGYPDEIEMRRLRDRFARPRPLPPQGIVLTDVLAEILGVGVGDTVELEVLEGERGKYRVVVAGLIDEAMGLQGHMASDALHRMLGQERQVSVVFLRIDPLAAGELDHRLKDLPYVADVTRRSALLARFREQSGNMIVTVSLIISLFAATITVGVVYNNARVALATRARELASLRVLGFTRAEISSILLGELAIHVLFALPFGLALGLWFVHALAGMVDPETYRLPVVLTGASYAFAAAITLLAAVVSALIVRRGLDRLDLIGVLKTRE
jgi:putative ABC transport system permease protein